MDNINIDSIVSSIISGEFPDISSAIKDYTYGDIYHLSDIEKEDLYQQVKDRLNKKRSGTKR